MSPARGQIPRRLSLRPRPSRRVAEGRPLVLQTPDDPRLEAQPLYLSGAKIGGRPRNVVFQATMGNWVYAWDADTGYGARTKTRHAIAGVREQFVPALHDLPA